RTSREEIFAEHLRYESLFAPRPEGTAPDHDRDPTRRLRVGYVSGDFRVHAASGFIASILAHHDRSQVEAICYSDVISPDAMTQHLQALAHGWRALRGAGDAEAAEHIRAERVDILVDLSGHTGGNRLGVFARKPAPIQVSYLGYPNTTGLRTI